MSEIRKPQPNLVFESFQNMKSLTPKRISIGSVQGVTNLQPTSQSKQTQQQVQKPATPIGKS
jgi:hypothetical protein